MDGSDTGVGKGKIGARMVQRNPNFSGRCILNFNSQQCNMRSHQQALSVVHTSITVLKKFSLKMAPDGHVAERYD